MTVSHVAGYGVGAVLAPIIAALLSKYAHYDITLTDAALIGSAAVGAGVGLGHGIGKFGLKGLIARVWSGEPKVKSVPTQTVPTPPAAAQSLQGGVAQ